MARENQTVPLAHSDGNKEHAGQGNHGPHSLDFADGTTSVLGDYFSEGSVKPKISKPDSEALASAVQPIPTAKAVMGTNDNCTVSKRSVERLYYEEPHFYRHFVKKPKRRAALINRGYWLRMQVIERSLTAFLAESKGSQMVVLNLGCGYDALPFRLLATKPDLCKDTVFVDIDYESLMLEKVEIINETEQLRSLLGNPLETQDPNEFLLRYENYAALSCDLRDLDRLDRVIRGAFDPTASFLVLCEVSITYMNPADANALIEWAGSLGKVRLHLLEQCMPNGIRHPFASTMLNHFDKLQSPLRVVESYPRIKDQRQRVHALRWQSASAQSLWGFWNDIEYFSPAERASLNSVEAFDEWEEFALFAAHYFFLSADNNPASSPREGQQGLPKVRPAVERQLSVVDTHSSTGACPPRRFAALFQTGNGVFDFHGGENGTRRVSSTDIFASSVRAGPTSLPVPPGAGVRMHHTVTALSEPFDCLLVGGRDGPDKPLFDCWLRPNGHWKRTDDLPTPLYRHAATLVQDHKGREGVLVFGGRSVRGNPSGSWYLWQERAGWKQLECYPNALTPRFGANMALLEAGDTGLLLGGMSEEGSVREECYRWSLDTEGNQPRVRLENYIENIEDCGLCRFGASLTKSPSGLIITGGIQSSGLPPPGCEICRLDVSSERRPHSSGVSGISQFPGWNYGNLDPQPLLIGHSAVYDGRGVIIIGGGATCFSFGNYMNSDMWRFNSIGKGASAVWKLVQRASELASANGIENQRTSVLSSYALPLNGSRPEFVQVKNVDIDSSDILQKQVTEGVPCIFESVDIGPCVNKWTMEYLKEAIGLDRQFDIHHAQQETMLFGSKNFAIRKNTLPEFLDAIARGERRYLRSISSQDRHKPANFSQDFEALDADFRLPDELRIPAEQVHSSVLRISGPINMWLHYDVMPNILSQILGTKRLFLFPPGDVVHLQIPPGRSSSDLNVFDPKAFETPPLCLTRPHEVILNPGDVLFIPPLWCHAAIPLDGISVAINTFFKAPGGYSYAAGLDTYGNRDVPEYEYGRKDVARAVARFREMPPEMGRFYLERLGVEILERAREMGL